MKSSNVRLFSRLVVFSLVISLLSVQTMIASALPAKGVSAAEITVSGQGNGGEKPFVVVNGERAFNGRTFFSNGNVATTESSSATISLGKLGRIDLAPSSSLTLSFSEGQIEGVLTKGNVSISNTDGVAVKIDTPNDSVTNEGTGASRFTVSVLGNQTGVSVANGIVRHNGGELAKHDDDDDDEEWKTWAAVAVIGGIIAAVVVVIALSDDDDDTVSPVR